MDRLHTFRQLHGDCGFQDTYTGLSRPRELYNSCIIVKYDSTIHFQQQTCQHHYSNPYHVGYLEFSLSETKSK